MIIIPAIVNAQSTIENIHQSGFIYCIRSTITTFNPQKEYDGLAVEVLAPQLYNRLLGIDPYTYDFLPELAITWEKNPSGTIYTLQLRPGVSFQSTTDFSPTRYLNADDVIFSFDRIININNPYHSIGNRYYPYFDSIPFSNNIVSIKKLDAQHVQFELKQPDASFLSHLASYSAPILSAEYAHQLLLQAQPEILDRYPVGTGPYQLSEYYAGKFIRLTNNPQYWQGIAKMSQAIIDVGLVSTGRISKLLTGECDVLAYPATTHLPILRTDPHLSLTQRKGMNIAYLALNTEKFPLNNLDIRQAINLAIDKQRLIKAIYFGSATVMASFLPDASWASMPDDRLLEYDPTEARSLLEKNNIKTVDLTLWVPIDIKAYNPSPLKMAELLQYDLAQIGINLTIQPIENSKLEDQLANKENYDLILTGWGSESNEPNSFFYPLLSCKGTISNTNYTHWCNSEFDKLLNTALKTESLVDRKILYEQVQQILMHELPILPLASALHLQTNRKDIAGLVPTSFGSGAFNLIYRITADKQGNTP